MTVFLFYSIIVLTLIVAIVAAILSRRFALRDIPAYDTMRLNIDQALETNMAAHMSFGSSAIRDTSTISAVASAAVLYYIAARATLADKPTLVTMSDPVTLSLGQDILWRAHRARGALSKYHGTMAHWYPQGPQSMAFAAGAGAAIIDDDAAANIFLGRFGPEMMLMAESAIRYNRPVVAQSDRVDGQAVAFAVSETPLIGEELYAGSAYLEPRPLHIGGVVAQDALRYAIILAMIILAAIAFSGGKF